MNIKVGITVRSDSTSCLILPSPPEITCGAICYEPWYLHLAITGNLGADHNMVTILVIWFSADTGTCTACSPGNAHGIHLGCQYQSTGITWQGMVHEPALGLGYSSMSKQQQQQMAAALQAVGESRSILLALTKK